MAGEHSPERKGKFSSDCDEMLYLMAQEQWGTDSDGDMQTPHGWFAVVDNRPEELLEIGQAFDEHDLFKGDLSDIVGSYIVHENSDGKVTIYEFGSFAEVRAAFDAMSDAYQDWSCPGS